MVWLFSQRMQIGRRIQDINFKTISVKVFMLYVPVGRPLNSAKINPVFNMNKVKFLGTTCMVCTSLVE